MSTAARLLTYQDLLSTPDDGRRYELIGGEIVASPSPLLKHQRLSGLLFALFLAIERRGLGFVFVAPTDVRLSANDVVVPTSPSSPRRAAASSVSGPLRALRTSWSRFCRPQLVTAMNE